jgi:hypothetical protein
MDKSQGRREDFCVGYVLGNGSQTRGLAVLRVNSLEPNAVLRALAKPQA